jgi:hypothetical protein
MKGLVVPIMLFVIAGGLMFGLVFQESCRIEPDDFHPEEPAEEFMQPSPKEQPPKLG